MTLAKVMAPFTPFLSEEIYKNLTKESSVHLVDWPETNEKLIDEKLNDQMRQLREIISVGLQKRAEAKIKVRQPIKEVILHKKYEKIFRGEDLSGNYFIDVLLEELNVKNLGLFREFQDDVISLDTNITPELKIEGEAREIIRAIQEGRKKAGFNVEDRIVLGYQGKENVCEMFGDMIAKEVLATEIKNDALADAEYHETLTLEGARFSFFLKRIK